MIGTWWRRVGMAGGSVRGFWLGRLGSKTDLTSLSVCHGVCPPRTTLRLVGWSGFRISEGVLLGFRISEGVHVSHCRNKEGAQDARRVKSLTRDTRTENGEARHCLWLKRAFIHKLHVGSSQSQNYKSESRPL